MHPKSASTRGQRRRASSFELPPHHACRVVSRTLLLHVVSFICFLSVNGANSLGTQPDPSSVPTTTPGVNASRAPPQPTIQATFATPNQAINITHVTYDPLYDTIYLGATNALYQLNGSDLSQQHEHITGPIYDNPSCGINECHGYEDYMKPTTNVNKVLVIDYQHKKLLSCGSVKQGACRRYELDDISQKEDLIPVAVAANDDNSSTYAFIAPARYNYDASSSSSSSSSTGPSNGFQQQVLYVGTTYTKLGQSRDLLVPAIGTRLLNQGSDLLKLYENVLDSARIDINSHLRDYFLVNYLYGFASSNYIYFVTVQKKATTRDYEELGYHTRLARICITDSSYNSYTEVDLKCMPNRKKSTPKHQSFFGSNYQDKMPNEYPLLQDAILVDAGSQLLQSLAQNDQTGPLSGDLFYGSPSSGSASSDDSKVLLAVFSSAKDHTQHAGEHSALCAFSLSQIEEKFNDNIHSCYTGKMQSRNMEYIAGNVQECPKSGQGGNVVNFCHETLKINGTLPIVSEASLQLYNTTLTAITATSHVNSEQKNIYSEQLASEFQSHNLSEFTSSSSNIQQSAASPHTVVFMGTSNGHLKKVLLNNASNGIEFDDVQLDSDGNPIIGDLHLDSSGRHLFAATPYKVMKVAIENCGQYSTCRKCSQSRNPYCGWCSLKQSCTSKSECLSSVEPDDTREPITSGRQQQATTTNGHLESAFKSQLKWISSESAAGKCVDLQSIVPDKMPITSTGKVDLYIDRLQRAASSSGSSSKQEQLSYKCIFDKKEQTVATSTQFGLSCPLPKVMHRPKIQPGKDHVVVELSVRSSESNTDLLNGKVTFFDCQQQTTCLGCLTSDWGCNWCFNENVCLFNTSKCDKTGPASRLMLDSTTNATTQMPLITISNAANQRSALSLTTISAFGGSGGISSTLVQSNQRTSNTISSVTQCPGYDPSLFVKSQDQGNNPLAAGLLESTTNSRTRPQPTKDSQQQPRRMWRPDNVNGQQNSPSTSTNSYLDSYVNDNSQNRPVNPARYPTGQQRQQPNYPSTTISSGSVMSTISSQQQQQDPSYPASSEFYPIRPMIGADGNADSTWLMSKSPYQPQYTVRQENNDTPSVLQRVSSYVSMTLLSLVYLTLGTILVLFVYTGFVYGCRVRRNPYEHLEYRGILAKIDLLERSVKNECRLASMSLRSDLNELSRHVELSGIPLLDFKNHVMKVFFPGINNHPLLVKSAPSSSSTSVQQASSGPQSLIFSQQQQQQQHLQSQQANNLMLQQSIQWPIKNVGANELPMEYFERLILTKPFLVTFINTLEKQPTFTIRDRVNVASLIMIVLMDKLDYATDILRTLLFQLVERSVAAAEKYQSDDEDYDEMDLQQVGRKSRPPQKQQQQRGPTTGWLDGSPVAERASRAAKLGKVVGGSASSLMASTKVAAQMFISKVGNKTCPLEADPSEFLTQQNSFTSIMSSTLNHSMSTTAFNHNRQHHHGPLMASTISGKATNRTGRAQQQQQQSAESWNRSSNQPHHQQPRQSAHLMLRRTDSIVEKMLTDWLALNMYEHFNGNIGQSLYMMFEALKCQLERGPIDAVSGDAFYSLNENKLLKELFIQFEMINLCVIVDTEILQSSSANSNADNTPSLMDSSLKFAGQQPLYATGDCLPSFKSNYATTTNNTITLAVRVLDCDTISQVKSKILGALYRNSPQSTRIGVEGVELTLRQHHQTMRGQPLAGQYSSVSLQDEDLSPQMAANGMRRLNTLKHYGVNNHAIVMMNRRRMSAAPPNNNNNNNNRTSLTAKLEEHYNNPYSEIQYGPLAGSNQQAALLDSQAARSWHLVQLAGSRNVQQQPAGDSSSSSNSPSMMLLANDCLVPSARPVQTLQASSGPAFIGLNRGHQHHQAQQQYYHPSSSSTSSSGNVMDTNSTSANSNSSGHATNLLARTHTEQPIYCQIGSQNGASSSYYCQLGGLQPGNYAANTGSNRFDRIRPTGLTDKQERHIYLTRMLISKGTVQCHIDDFFKTILNVKPQGNKGQAGEENIIAGSGVLCSSASVALARSRANLSAQSPGACPPAVKWLFDLLDEAAQRTGITDQSVVHSWKSNAFLLRFWVNFIKNPDYIMDVEKSDTLDATLSVVAQTLMDSCSTGEPKLSKDSASNKLLFAKNISKYQNQVKRFYQDVASMRPISDQEIVKHMSSLSATNAGKFDTHLALKELCVYAVDYGAEIADALNNDLTCQQLSLPQQLDQCFRSLTLFEAYR